MKFARLFAAGKNLMSGRGSRYQTDKHFHLPQFISPKNPFQQAARREAATILAASTETATPNLPPVEAEPGTRVAPTSKPTPTAHSATRASIFAWLKSLPVTIWRKLNPVAWFFRPVRPAVSPIPRFGRASAVQAELHLEKVRVMGNDLCDADLEVVPVGADVSKPAPGRIAWSQLGARVFGGGSTR